MEIIFTKGGGMKFLFLVILYTQVFSGIKDRPVFQEVVPSVEHASIILWEKSKSESFIERGTYDAYLYEIDLVAGSVIQLTMPTIEFINEAAPLTQGH